MDAYRIPNEFVTWAKSLGYTFESQKEEAIFQKQIFELSKSSYAPLFDYMMSHIQTPQSVTKATLQQKLASETEEFKELSKSSKISQITEDNLNQGLELEESNKELEEQIKKIKYDISREESNRDQLLRSISEVRERNIYLLHANKEINSTLTELESDYQQIKDTTEKEQQTLNMEPSILNPIEEVYTQISMSLDQEVKVCIYFKYTLLLPYFCLLFFSINNFISFFLFTFIYNFYFSEPHTNAGRESV